MEGKKRGRDFPSLDPLVALAHPRRSRRRPVPPRVLSYSGRKKKAIYFRGVRATGR